MGAAQTNPTSYETIADVNARLDQLGFSKLTADQAAQVRNNVPRDRFIRALTLADSDTGAWNFLRSLVNLKDSKSKDSGESQQETNVYHMDNNPTPQDSAAQNSQPGPAPHPEQPNAYQGQGEKRYISHHVYGGKAALCWQVDSTRKGEPTICLEAAGAVGERAYDWKNKITIQLTRDELPCVAATFLGIIPETKGTNHGIGDNKGKGFEIKHQGDKLFVRVFAPGKQMPVPVSPEDAFTVVALLMRQIQEAKPWMNATDIIATLRCVHGRMLQTPAQ